MNAALDRMLDLVRAHERGEREAILAQARADARKIIADAHRAARARLRHHALEMRQTMRRDIARAQAALETTKRRQHARADLALLDTGRAQLRAALIERWRDPGARRTWIETLVRQATASLPKTAWEVAHPADWPQAERTALAQRLERECHALPRFVEAANLSAGLAIRAGGAVLDGTLDGLLFDRRAIEARLLAELDRQP